jgi:hypothetical protein
MRASRYPEAAFLATMTAGATHEVRNVLAIIKESAGLIDDLVQVFGRRGTLDQEKLRRAVDRIDTQVRRGADLLTSVNRLCHTLDQDLDSVELNEEVEQVVFLSQRFARKKGHSVAAGNKEGDAVVRVHPLRLHMALFSAVETCVGGLPEGAVITVAVRERDGLPAVELLGASREGGALQPIPASDTWSRLLEQVDSLGASLERLETGCGLRILFPDPREGLMSSRRSPEA